MITLNDSKAVWMAVMIIGCFINSARSQVSKPPAANGNAGAPASRKLAEQKVKSLYAEANRVYAEGRVQDAAKLLERLLVALDELYPAAEYPNGTRDSAQILRTLGGIAMAQGDLPAAETWFKKSLGMYQRLDPVAQFPNGNLDIANGLANVGSVLVARGHKADARTRLEEALGMIRRLFPPEQGRAPNALAVVVLNDLGLLAQMEGDLNGAFDIYTDALETCRQIHPEAANAGGHPQLAQCLIRHGTAANLIRKNAVARESLSRALKMLEHLDGPNAPPNRESDISTALVGLASVARSEDAYDEAMTYYERGLVMLRRLSNGPAPNLLRTRLALTLTSIGQMAQSHGDLTGARDCFTEAASLYERQYADGSAGRRELANSLCDLAIVLLLRGESGASARLQERILSTYAEPRGNGRDNAAIRDTAVFLDRLGSAHSALSRFVLARQYYERAVSLLQDLNKDEHDEGGTELATATNNLAYLYSLQGEATKARDLYERSLAINRGLARNSPALVASISNSATAMLAIGESERAEKYSNEALNICVTVYPQADYPAGHPDVALVFETLGQALKAQGKLKEAERYLRQALAIYESHYPEATHPNGHRRLAACLNNLADLCALQGNYRLALDLQKRSTAMFTALYPTDLYPDGHRELADSLANLGGLLQLQEAYADATETLLHAQDICQKLIDAFVFGASEAESLNFLSRLPPTRDALLTISHHKAVPADRMYSGIWARRGLVAQLSSSRWHPNVQPKPSERELAGELRRVQVELSRHAMAPAGGSANEISTVREKMRKLLERKEHLERQAAAVRPGSAQKNAPRRAMPIALTQNLPTSEIYVDFARYIFVEKSGKSAGYRDHLRTPSYVAFIQSRSHQLEIVELGPAARVDAAVDALREAIRSEKPSDSAGELRRLVWEPIEKRFPPGTKTVYLTPEGPLTALPWAALPGKKRGTVLLEDYALALVPYGQLLLDQLTGAPRADSADDVLLAVGGVAYDEQPIAPPDDGGKLALRGEVGLEGPRVRWPELPGTQSEVDALAQLAGNRTTTLLSRGEASTARVLAELPKARWAVFATHGFFADPKFRSALQLDESIFEKRDFLFGGERTTPVGRNPLLLSGLVLAGANLPRPNDEFGIPMGDGGILSAEQIAGLPLDKLELAVLSACDTGLGEVAGGEGVFGLQRAFHQAGAANVVASLWKIDDQATAALMRLFYFKLFRENKAPLAALREAQLAIYHHPEQIGPLASARAPEFGKAVKLVDGGKAKKPGGRAATRLWAGFVLSGAGR
ncbi:MAG TPA: CHAT domain-containing tetratricopeptide repeat protein [Pirellulales bacterium]